MENTLTTDCCIAGGGPAGMMLGFLMARAGVEVLVLEKHVDFLRDFRGDTVHPSTLEVMHELGLLEDFLKLPFQKVEQLGGKVGDSEITIADFSHLSVQAPFIAMMPQWDFLNFLASHARAYPNFKLMMQAEVTGLIESDGKVVGAIAQTPQGEVSINSTLLVGADGRHSTVRDKAGLHSIDYGAPMDVLWFRLSRNPRDTMQTLGRFMPGKILVMINRGEYWQCGYVIPKGEMEHIRSRGLDSFRSAIAEAVPLMHERVSELKDWEQIKLLTVTVDRLQTWYRQGVLCIGDAAHAMSPVGGVGINLAVQDAVAAANILAEPLKHGQLTVKHLRQVQQRREWPARMTQALQFSIQKKVIYKVLHSKEQFTPPLMFRLLARLPFLRRITGYMVGIGVRPEHVRTVDIKHNAANK